MSRSVRRLLGNTRGAAAMEFALVMPPFMLLIMGVLDLGHIMWTKSMLQGAIEKAARDSALESTDAARAATDARVTAQLNTALKGVTPVFSRRAYQDFSNVGKPEPFVDGNSNNTRDSGECYQDINGNTTWDTDSARSNSQGNAAQVAVYTVTVTYPHYFPLPALVSLVTKQPQVMGNVSMSASTVLRNQPYDDATVPRIICTP